MGNGLLSAIARQMAASRMAKIVCGGLIVLGRQGRGEAEISCGVLRDGGGRASISGVRNSIDCVCPSVSRRRSREIFR